MSWWTIAHIVNLLAAETVHQSGPPRYTLGIAVYTKLLSPAKCSMRCLRAPTGHSLHSIRHRVRAGTGMHHHTPPCFCHLSMPSIPPATPTVKKGGGRAVAMGCRAALQHWCMPPAGTCLPTKQSCSKKQEGDASLGDCVPPTMEDPSTQHPPRALVGSAWSSWVAGCHSVWGRMH
jgi:hypothetical protein